MLTAVVVMGKRLLLGPLLGMVLVLGQERFFSFGGDVDAIVLGGALIVVLAFFPGGDRKSTRLNSSHANISYAVFCLKKKKRHKLLHLNITYPLYRFTNKNA